MRFGVVDLLAQYRARALRPTQVIEDAFRRAKAGGLRPIWICLADESAAIERAAGLEKADPESLPLYGVPFAVKDNIDVAGLPTTAGCPEYAYTPNHSATVVKRLEAAGAILIGKTNLDQFATGLVGVRSPYGACSSVFDPRYISGGSSSGSAVAVARDMVSFSLGTDTAGSGRVPAAFNGIIGTKPTRGRISTAGVVPACRTLDCVSIFTQTARDATVVFAAAQGLDESDPFSRTGHASSPWLAGGLRAGVPPRDQLEFFGDSAAAELFAQAVERMRALNAEIVEIDYTPFRDAANLLYSGPWVAERLATIGPFLKAHPAAGHEVVRKIIEGGARYSAVDTFTSTYRLAELRRATEAEWRKMDVLLLPTTGTIYTIEEVLADPVGLNTNLGYYTNFVNLLDLAAVSVPAGHRPNGLPFGVTFLSHAFQDEALLTLARRWEDASAVGHAEGCVPLAVVGAHLTGEPLNHQLTSRGARLMRTCRTAPSYKLYALPNTTPPKPGLVFEPGYQGSGVEIEVWSMPLAEFGSFVAEIPAPLGIGTLITDTGESVKGFLCEGHAIRGAEEITRFGGWRNWLSGRSAGR